MNQSPQPQPRRPARPAGGVNWYRFWMQTLAAVVVFNIAAVLLTVYVIWPWLHPAK